MNTAGTAGSELPGPAGRAVRERLGTTGRITILTGAGVSAESGISTFRSAGGLWEQHSLEEVATPEGFERNPSLVLAFYNERRRKLLAVEPNPGHAALARLERSLGPRFTLITQNIDDLHERAGTQSVLHMHGELLKARCVGCAGVLEWRDDIRPQDTCPSCGAGLRPHVVWFGEIPFYLEEEIPRALDADVFIAVGTSGNVYPAAGMVHEARLRGKLTLEVNLEASANAHHFDLRVLGPAGSVLPELVSEIVSGG